MLTNFLKSDFLKAIDFDPIEKIRLKKDERLPADYFAFYQSVSSVYSSMIEGENIDFDSFFKHKFLNVSYKPDYTKKADDLFRAYEFIRENPLTYENVVKSHQILSEHLLPDGQRGEIRNNPMFVLNADDRIEYVACDAGLIKKEIKALFEQIEKLLKTKLTGPEVFFYAAQIHLVFVKIHPFQDGNGRTARLLEKWFLTEKAGPDAVGVDLEKNYFKNREDYYKNIRKIGLEYPFLDYSKSLPFLLMTINSLK